MYTKNKVGYCNIQAEKPTLYYIPNYIPKLKSFLLTFYKKTRLVSSPCTSRKTNLVLYP